MSDAAVLVLRDVRVDPRPRVLGGFAVPSAFDARPLPTPDEGAARTDPLAAAREEGRRLGRDDARRDASAALDALRAAHAEALAAAVATAHAEAHDNLRAETALRIAEADAARDAVLARARSTADLRPALEAAVDRARETLLDDALALAYEATLRFVGEAATAADAEVRRDRLRALVGQAVATQLGGRALLRVRLHPDDLASIGDGSGGAPWTAVGDADVGRGGCRIDTAHGSLDARLATVFDRLRTAWSDGGAPL